MICVQSKQAKDKAFLLTIGLFLQKNMIQCESKCNPFFSPSFVLRGRFDFFLTFVSPPHWRLFRVLRIRFCWCHLKQIFVSQLEVSFLLSLWLLNGYHEMLKSQYPHRLQHLDCMIWCHPYATCQLCEASWLVLHYVSLILHTFRGLQGFMRVCELTLKSVVHVTDSLLIVASFFLCLYVMN